ncbi:MAG: alpha-D-ribose 1-methylphosphonate 5-triphosphate diphosphatase [Spirochaetota bacterium]
MKSCCINNVRLILPECQINGSIVVENGKIAAIEEGREFKTCDQAIDGQGQYLIPGLIDLHGDDIEFELGALGTKAASDLFPVEVGLVQSDKNAAAWGITTKLHALAYFEDESKGRSIKLSRLIMDTLQEFQKGGHCLIEHMIDLRYEITGDPDYTLEIMEHPTIKMISFMDHTPGEGQFRDEEHYISLNLKLTNATEEELKHLAAEKKQRQPLKHRNMEQVASKARELRLVMASHDDHTGEKVENMHSLGCRFAEMPITLEAAAKARKLHWFVTMSAPNVVRGGSSSGHLSAVDAIQENLVDCLCSDYHLPSLLNACFMLHQTGILTLPDALKLISENPAKALGLTDRGSLTPGKTADLVLVNNSMGFPVVVGSFVKGKLVYHDKRFEL